MVYTVEHCVRTVYKLRGYAKDDNAIYSTRMSQCLLMENRWLWRDASHASLHIDSVCCSDAEVRCKLISKFKLQNYTVSLI